MIQDLRNRMEAQIEKMQEMFNKDLEELKNKQTKMNNTITETKNTLEGINSRITETEERISDLGDRIVEFTATEQNKEKEVKRNEDSLRDLWDNIKRNNICIIGVPGGEEREKEPGEIFEEIIVENIPNVGKEIATQVQESQRVPGRRNPRRNTPIKNKARMSPLTIPIQHHAGTTDWKGMYKTVTSHRQHNCLHRKSQAITKKNNS